MMKKLALLIICIILAALCVTALADDNGSCGAVNWKLQGTKLTISGSGAMTSYTSASSYPWYQYRNTITQVIVENGVTGLGNYAFQNYPSLLSAEIADSVSVSGTHTFENCASLTEVRLPSSVAIYSMYVFRNCSSLKKLEFPNSNQIIGSSCFEGCTALEEVVFPGGGGDIFSNAFKGCTSLTTLHLAKESKISAQAFSGCTGIETIYYAGSKFSRTETTLQDSNKAGNDSLYDAHWICDEESKSTWGSLSWEILKDEDVLVITGSGAINDIPQITNIVGSGPVTNNTVCWRPYRENLRIREIRIGEGITGIGRDAFRGYKYVTKVTLPSTLTQIGETAFIACSELQTVSFPASLKSTGSNAFANCTGLTAVTFPDSVNTLEIGYSTFFNCTNLKTVKLPKGLTIIQGSAFDGCAALEELSLPSGLKTIGKWAFSDCTGLKKINIPTSVTEIVEKAFEGCTGLQSVTISLCNAYAINWMKDNGLGGKVTTTPHENVVEDPYVAPTATATGLTAGSHCSVCGTVLVAQQVIPALNSGTPDNPPSGGGNPDNPGDNPGENPGSSPEVDPTAPTAGGAALSLNAGSGTATVTGTDGSGAGTINIPDSVTVNGTTYKVTEIAANAFKGQKKVTKVTIGKNVKTIGKNAFYGCTGLKTVSGMAGLVTIGDGAFQKCTALKSFTIVKTVTKIGKNAFNGCKKLAKITIKTAKLTKKTIGKNSFKGISAKAVFKCPKKQKKDYAAWLKKPGGAPKTSKVK